MLVFKNGTMNLEYGEDCDLQEKYDRFIHSLGDFSHVICPSCHSKGSLRRFNTYSRYCFNKPADLAHSLRITVLCLKCSCRGCGHSHALLPEWICPFLPFTYPFILEILNAFFSVYHQRILPCAHNFGLSRSSVRLLLLRLKENRLNIRETAGAELFDSDPLRILKNLKRDSRKLAEFLSQFLHRTASAFLTRQFPPSSFWTLIRYGPMGPSSNQPDISLSLF